MQASLTILVVDQDPPTLQTVTEAIQGCEAVVVACRSLEAAFDTIQDRAVAVVLLELEPPFEKAFKLLAELQTYSPGAAIVFLSKFDDVELWLEAIHRGAFDVFPRPLEPTEVRRIVLHALERHHLIRAKGRAVS
jgi:DNA-binding NtrC family response regulator